MVFAYFKLSAKEFPINFERKMLDATGVCNELYSRLAIRLKNSE